MQIKLSSDHWRTPLLFQSRVHCDCNVGVTVQQLLSADFALPLEYIDKRIETVFLNGQPLDDLEKAVIRSGDRLVLAAGLPGAAGICMRRKSPLQSYRADISRQNSANGSGEGESPTGDSGVTAITARATHGRIELALFSLLMKELYAHFMRRGVWLSAQRLSDLLAEDENCRVWLVRQGQEQGQDGLQNTEESTRESVLDALAALPAQEQVLLSSP